MIYKNIIKPILFKFDPEKIHDFMVSYGELAGKWALGRFKISLLYNYRGKDISKTVDGIKYRTPILLSAGFAYNARLMNILPSIGLAGEEIGSVTARPCAGNPAPRLTRLPKSKSILVNKGLRDDGVEKIIERIKKYRSQKRFNGKDPFVLGISIARTNDEKSVPIEAGIEDYVYSFKRLNEENVGDYYTLNISCPNSFGGEAFTNPSLLERLLIAIKKIPCSKPIYIKMPINIAWDEFKKLLDIIDKNNINGVIIGNLNKDYSDLDVREEAPDRYCGGLSGKPCFHPSTELIRNTRVLYGKRFTIITGLIYQGPGVVKKICKSVTI